MLKKGQARLLPISFFYSQTKQQNKKMSGNNSIKKALSTNNIACM